VQNRLMTSALAEPWTEVLRGGHCSTSFAPAWRKSQEGGMDAVTESKAMENCIVDPRMRVTDIMAPYRCVRLTAATSNWCQHFELARVDQIT